MKKEQKNRGMINIKFYADSGSCYGMTRKVDYDTFVKAFDIIDPSYLKQFPEILGEPQGCHNCSDCSCANKSIQDKADKTQQKQDALAGSREQAFQFANMVGTLMKGFGFPHAEEFADKLKNSAIKIEEEIRAKDKTQKNGNVSQQNISHEDLKNMEAKAKLETARKIFNEIIPEKLKNAAPINTEPAEEPKAPKAPFPILGIGIIGKNITENEIGMIADILGDSLIEAFNDNEPEFKPMDCDHQCFSCKSLGSCETIKRAMAKSQNNPVQ